MSNIMLITIMLTNLFFILVWGKLITADYAFFLGAEPAVWLLFPFVALKYGFLILINLLVDGLFFFFLRKTAGENQSRFLAISEYVPVPCAIVEIATKKTIFVNAAVKELLRLQDMEKEEFINNFPEEEEKVKIIESIKQAVGIREREIQIQTKEGRQIWVLLSLVIIKYENKDCAMFCFVDINMRKEIESQVALNAGLLEHQVQERTNQLKSKTDELMKNLEELEEARQAAEEANRSKGFFLANMSHELRTPLNAIIGYSEVLGNQAETQGNHSLADDIKKIYAAGKHLLRLINDILDFSKIEAGKMDIYAEEFQLSDLLTEVESVIKPLTNNKNNKLKIVNKVGDQKIFSDMVKIRQNLFNLLSNAAKFTENGEIIVEINPIDSEKIAIVVVDTGMGMTQEQMGKLFKAFSQGDESTTRKFGGTGLGLAITKSFCELLGGSIKVESEPGSGSKFTMAVLLDVKEVIARQKQSRDKNKQEIS